MYEFNVEEATKKCIRWVQEWFEKNGPKSEAIIGISGGKDSTVAAKILVEALGADRVIGVLMPNKIQSDIDVSLEVIKYLNIRYHYINIGSAYDGLYQKFKDEKIEFTPQANTNLPARLRMCTLYAIAQCYNGRVCNTCNYSEDYVGYATKYGDGAGDFSPLSNFTVAEVKAIGRYLGIPDKFIDKVPTDGLCGKTDEENLGFTYDMLDKYIREGIEPAEDIKKKIDDLHEKNLFKLRLMDSFKM